MSKTLQGKFFKDKVITFKERKDSKFFLVIQVFAIISTTFAAATIFPNTADQNEAAAIRMKTNESKTSGLAVGHCVGHVGIKSPAVMGTSIKPPGHDLKEGKSR